MHFQVSRVSTATKIKLPGPGCFAIGDCEIFGRLMSHARIWNLIFVFFTGAWFNHFGLFFSWFVNYSIVFPTWMIMLLCSSMRKLLDQRPENMLLKLKFASQTDAFPFIVFRYTLKKLGFKKGKMD